MINKFAKAYTKITSQVIKYSLPSIYGYNFSKLYPSQPDKKLKSSIIDYFSKDYLPKQEAKQIKKEILEGERFLNDGFNLESFEKFKSILNRIGFDKYPLIAINCLLEMIQSRLINQKLENPVDEIVNEVEQKINKYNPNCEEEEKMLLYLKGRLMNTYSMMNISQNLNEEAFKLAKEAQKYFIECNSKFHEILILVQQSNILLELERLEDCKLAIKEAEELNKGVQDLQTSAHIEQAYYQYYFHIEDIDAALSSMQREIDIWEEYYSGSENSWKVPQLTNNYFQLGYMQYRKGIFQNALQNLEKSLELFDLYSSDGDEEYVYQAVSIVADEYIKKGDYKQAKYLLEKQISDFQRLKVDSPLLYSYIYCVLGKLTQTESIEQIEQYILRAYECVNQVKDENRDLYLTCKYNAALHYISRDMMDESLKWITEAIKEVNGDISGLTLGTLSNISQLYADIIIKIEKYDEAMKHYDKSISYLEKNQDISELLIVLSKKAKLYMNTQQKKIQVELAIETIDKAIKIAEKNGIYSELIELYWLKSKFLSTDFPEKSLQYLKNALSLLQQLYPNNYHAQMEMLLKIIALQYELKSFNECLEEVEQGINLYNDHQDIFKKDVLQFLEDYKNKVEVSKNQSY